MGTAHDWMSAVFWGMLWAAGMMLWEALSRSDKNIKPVLSPADVLSGVFAGLGFGLGTTFRWRVFHWPLVLFIVAAFAGCAVFGRLAKRRLVSDPENS
jgi:hypothetical protein